MKKKYEEKNVNKLTRTIKSMSGKFKINVKITIFTLLHKHITLLCIILANYRMYKKKYNIQKWIK